MKIGDIVIYVMEFDSDTSYSPNVGPAVVAKVNANGTPDLVIMTLNGIFFKQNVPHGNPQTRMSYYVS